MKLEDLRSVLRARPFQPFEIQTDHGQKFLVKHPETLIANKSTAVFMEPDAPEFSIISIKHISALELKMPLYTNEDN